MTVGERIKERRKELGMSADVLAEKIGKNRATVYRYENGEIESLPLSALVPVAKALNVSPSELLIGKDNEEPEYDSTMQEVIALYSKLNDEQKATVLAMLRSFVV